MAVIGAVLAGGASKRMGRDKAEVEVGGEPMAALVVRALGEVADRVVAAGRSEPLFGAEPLPDPPGAPHRGPLAGLVAVFESSAERDVVVAVAVDQPWVRYATLARLRSRVADLAVVPVDNGIRQITCAAYPAGLAEAAAEELGAGGSVQSLLDRTAFDAVTEATWRGWGEDGRSWFSVDTAKRVDEGLARFGPPRGRR